MLNSAFQDQAPRALTIDMFAYTLNGTSKVARCPECLEELDTHHNSRHSIFILQARDAEENE
jgi:hypothetical protein